MNACAKFRLDWPGRLANYKEHTHTQTDMQNVKCICKILPPVSHTTVMLTDIVDELMLFAVSKCDFFSLYLVASLVLEFNIMISMIYIIRSLCT